MNGNEASVAPNVGCCIEASKRIAVVEHHTHAAKPFIRPFTRARSQSIHSPFALARFVYEHCKRIHEHPHSQPKFNTRFRTISYKACDIQSPRFRFYPDRFTRNTLTGEGMGTRREGATKYNSPSRVGHPTPPGGEVRTRKIYRTQREHEDAAGWQSSTTNFPGKWSKLQHARDQTASDFETRTQAPMSKTGHRTNDWTSSERPAVTAASRKAFTAGVVQ